jgi:hypothetical protein
MKDFRKKFSLHIHCQRQRTVFPVAGDKHISASSTCFRLEGGLLDHGEGQEYGGQRHC